MNRAPRYLVVLWLLAGSWLGAGACADALPWNTGDLRALVPALARDQIDELTTTGMLWNAFENSAGLKLVPGDGWPREIGTALASAGVTVGVEVVYLLPYTDTLDSAGLATLLLQLSTLAGLEFHSESQDRTRTLFERSFAIQSADQPDPIPDPVVEQVPAAGVVTVFQEDGTFGDNVSITRYAVTESSIHLVTTNAATFTWGPVPIIRGGGLQGHVLLLPRQGFILYYANLAARALKVNFFKKRITASFRNRLGALEGWFEGKLGP